MDAVTPPPGWDFIGDSPSVVLPDGRFVVGRKLDMQVAALDPATLTWTLLANTGKSDFNAEEGWTLLPDGTILTFDVLNAPNSEIYSPGTQTWTTAGSTIVESSFALVPWMSPLRSQRRVLLLSAGRSRSWYPPCRWPGFLYRLVFQRWTWSHRDLYACDSHLGGGSGFPEQ